MMDERLAPGVEDGEEADLGAEVARVGGNRAECLGDGSEEETVDDGLVLGGDLGDRRGHGEDDVEVLGGQQVLPSPFEPRGAGQRLTGRTVAVAAGVVPDAPMAAVVTLLDVAAEGGGSALLDGRHHAALRRREGGPGLGPEGIAVAAEDLRHGDRGARHGRRSGDVRSRFRYGPRKEVQRTRGRADRAGGEQQVAGRGLQAPMPEQKLNRTQVGARLDLVGHLAEGRDGQPLRGRGDAAVDTLSDDRAGCLHERPELGVVEVVRVEHPWGHLFLFASIEPGRQGSALVRRTAA